MTHTCIDGCTMPGESIDCLACDGILFYGALKALYALEGLGSPCIHAQRFRTSREGEDEQKTQRQEINKFLERMGPPLFDPVMANVKLGVKRRARGMRWIRWKLLNCWRDGGLQLCTSSHWVEADNYYLHKPALTDPRRMP